MGDSPLIEKIDPNMRQILLKIPKLINFITSSKCWDISSLVNVFLDHIIK